MATISLFKFNNYYNRVIKKLERNTRGYISESAITNAGGILITSFGNVNIHYGDGVNLEVIVNYDTWANEGFDYALILDYSDVVEGRSSLWFVMETTRLRNGQCKLSLYRDLINTYYDDIIEAPCFIEKATLPSTSDLIFNSENMTYNQIKKAEYGLYDCTKMPWIVGYISAKQEQATNNSFSVASNNLYTTTQSHSDWTYNRSFKYIPKNDYWINIFTLYQTATAGISATNRWSLWINNNGTRETYPETAAKQGNSYVSNHNPGDFQNSWFNFSTIWSKISALESAENEAYLETMMEFNGKTIQFSDGTYKVNVVKTNTTRKKVRNSPITDAYSTYMKSQITGRITAAFTGNPFGYECDLETYSVELEQVAVSGSYNWTIPVGAAKLNSAPYRMFMMPYPVNFAERNLTPFYQRGDTVMFDIIPSLNLAWANSIAKTLGDNLIDLQILPYCPLAAIDGLGMQTLYAINRRRGLRNDYGGTEGEDFIYLKNSAGVIKSVCFFVRDNTFKAVLGSELSEESPEPTLEFKVKDFKVESECDMYRICSPNYSGVFEINAAKNGGLKNFTAECTYKPYNPYICVHPQFGRLYGKDYGDARGLICGGDFSLDIEKDSWVSYELQNKNYQKTFQRSIENMEVNNSIANQNAVWGAVSGTITGAASGAVSGALMGGGAYGAIAGAAVGGITSATAGAADIRNQKKLQAETIDYTRDQFGYELGNIKALPNTLARVSSLTANSKYVPFIEYYTCSNDEKEALRNKMKYNGMTVMTIGKISDYQLEEKSYIKGKIIRLENMDIDFHEANVIAEEINKGVFI